MNSKTRQTVYDRLLVVILTIVLLVCVDILIHAGLQDHTALGDPYYQDTLLAIHRVPVTLIGSWLVVVLSISASLIKPK